MNHLIAAGFVAGLVFSLNASADSFLVKLKPSHAKASTAALSTLGIEVTSRIPQLSIVVSSTEPSLMRPDTRAAVEYIEKNYTRHADLYSVNVRSTESFFAADAADPEAGMLWGMKAIHAHDAWAISKGSKDVIAAISDTGAFEHFELKANFWANPGETGLDANGKDKSKNKVDDDKNGYKDDYRGWRFDGMSNSVMDSHYHGTHVSGTVGAFGGDKSGVAGVVWNTSLMEVPFLGSDGSGTDEDAIRTIIYAADNGARVLNASWGGGDDSKALRDSIEYAGKKGMLMVAAAGNDGQNTDKYPHFPSAVDSPYLISVAAMDASNRLAGFSNYGAVSVDLGAPGDDIYSTANPMCNCTERTFFRTLSGTSMATPHVTGAAALLFSINPKLGPLDVKAILLSTVIPNKDLKNKSVTGGTLNVGEAAKVAASTLR